MALTADKMQTYRKSMNGERKRILSTIASLHEELGSSLSDETDENGLETHLGDVATVTFLRERDLSIEEHEERILSDIDAALKRMQLGTFGDCDECRQPIPENRLQALPWAAHCITCQESLDH